MGEYQLILTARDGTAYDATQRVSSLSWSGSIRQTARQVETVLATPTDGSLRQLPTENGTGVQLLLGGAPVFTGVAVTRGRSTQGQTTDLSALDRGFYLAGNEGWYSYADAAPEQAVAALCADFGIPVGALAATGVRVARKFPGVALDKIAATLYTLAGEQNGRRYLLRFNGAGALEAVEKPRSAALEIAPRKNLQSLQVTEDISGLCNGVAIYTDTGQLVRTVEDGESIAAFGRLQRILQQRSGQDAGAEARAILEDSGQQQTMTVQCLGNPALITGNAVILRDNVTGASGLCWIDSDTHTFKNGLYFCKLGLNFRNLMNETSAGQAD